VILGALVGVPELLIVRRYFPLRRICCGSMTSRSRLVPWTLRGPLSFSDFTDVGRIVVDKLTVWDRCVFGAIAAFGGLLGRRHYLSHPFLRASAAAVQPALFLFSTVYFFFAGSLLGARAADLLGGATQVGMQRAMYELNPLATHTPSPPTVPSDTTTAIVAVGYVLGAIALVYLA
jgi:hypothetical protein